MSEYDDAGKRAGAFEAPSAPPAEPKLQVDPSWSARQLSGALVRGVWPWVAAGSALLIVYGAAGMLLPVVVGGLVDAVLAPLSAGTGLSELLGTLVLWAGLLAGLYILINLTYRFGGRLGWYGVQRSQYELSQAVLGRVLDPRGTAGPPQAPGRLLAVATADVHRACLVLYVTVYPPGQAIALLVAAGVLFTVHAALGIGVVIALPLTLVLMHLVARPLRRRSAAEQAGLADATAAAADLVAGYRVLRGLHAHGHAAQRYRGVSRQALRATMSARSARAGFEGASTAVAQLFAAALATCAAMLAFTERISAGELVTAAGIAVVLIVPLHALTGTLGSFWAVSQASAGRVLEMLSAEPSPAGLGQQVPGSQPITLECDRLDLNSQERPGDDSLQLTIRVDPGEFIVIDMPQQAQTILADVLAARRLPRSGAALLAGAPVHQSNPAALRERLLVMPHAPGIFAGTVLENVCATGDTAVPDSVGEQALKVVSLSGIELAGGCFTQLNDGGPELSGGQRERVALARAVAADPEVLVLVEPCTSVDAVTEQRIASGLHGHRRGRTTLVLTSSPVFLSVADRVVSISAEPVRTEDESHV